MNFKVVAVAVLIVVYLYGLLLDIVRCRSDKNPIPGNVADVYDGETYQKWRAYHGEKVRWGMATKAAGFAVDRCEHEPGVFCVAAPILDRNGFAVAGISVSGAEIYLKPRLAETSREIIRAAAEISRAFSGGEI